VLSVLLHRNIPGLLRGEDSRSHYYDAPLGGTTHRTYGGTYPQAHVSSVPQSGISVGYDTSQAFQRPPLGQSPSSGEPHFPYPLGFVHQQNPGPMTAGLSPPQGPAGIRNVVGSYSHQSANESQSPYPLGFIHPQNPGPMTSLAATRFPSQRPGVQNTWGGPHSQGYLNCTIFAPASNRR
jgi:hypothetical protein